MQITNVQGLPEPIVRAVANDPYTRGDSDFSVTQLLQPPRKVQLEQRFSEQLVEDAADRLWALVGQVAHGILERAEVEAIAEQRIYAQVGGFVVSGATDRLILVPEKTGYVLQDYKFVTAYGVKIEGGAKPEWIEQLNSYRYLLHQNGYNIARMEVVAIYRDWSKLEAKRNQDYPQTQAQRLPVPRWSLDDAETFLAERVALHADAAARATDWLPDCTDEDRWLKPGKVAVQKVGNKTASRVTDTPQEAVRWMAWKGLIREDEQRAVLDTMLEGGIVKTGKAEYTLEYRPPSYPRCESYCAAAPVCAQWAQVCREQGWDHPMNREAAE